MLKLDHLALPVADEAAARAWYVDVLGMTVEFEVPARRTVAVRDGHDFAIFLVGGQFPCAGLALWFQVDDVDARHAELAARGVAFSHPPLLLNGTTTAPDIVGIRNRAGLAADVVKGTDSVADAIAKQIAAIRPDMLPASTSTAKR